MIKEPFTPETPPLTVRECKLMDSLTRQNEIICSLKQSLTAAQKENAKLAEDLENARKHDRMLQEHLAAANAITPEKLYAPMMRALCTLYQDEVMPNELGMSAAAYCLLLDELEVRT